MTCPSCGSTAPADARFCPACGHSLVARPDERRVATVLFADLVGFTSLSESADPEHIKNLVDGCFERLAAEVTTFGGQVDKVIGDALVALFGAPVAHEDDAERAVRAALRMQERLVEMRAENGLDVHLRIGVNTGEVLVGALRAGGDYTAMGDVVNTASRLQASAGPDQVIVGPATYAAARRGVHYEPLGELAVRGREEPVTAWLAVGAIAPPGHRHDRAESPLVGRDSEVTVLRAALATATTRKRAHLVLVTGEAGVGKTRLATELGRVASCEQGALVLSGQCIPYGETNEWWPVATMVAEAAEVDLTDPEATVPRCTRSAVRRVLALAEDDPETSRITDGLLYLMREVGPGEGVDPTRAREDALRAALTFFAGLATHQPLVLVLSDLHWADDAVLEFVPRLLAHVASSAVVVVGTTRPELTDRWSPPAGRHNTVHVNLDPLATEDTDELLSLLLPDADAELLATLRDRSGGNPFFIEELVAMLGETGDGSESDLPATLHGLLAARLDRLDAGDRVVLEDAAVIGNTGPLQLVRSLAGVRDATADAALDRLSEKDLLELDGDEYRFRNELTREVAYGTLTKAERARRHGTLAKLIATDAEANDRIDEDLDRLAYHFNVAASLMDELGAVADLPQGMNVGAVKFLTRAAERAEQRDDWQTANRYLTHAIPLVEADDIAGQLRLRLDRARARSELRDCPAARSDLTQVLAMAESLGDARALAAATTVLGDVEYKEGNLEGSARTLDDAVTRWRALDDPRGLGDALRFRGLTDLFRGEVEGAAASIGEALELFRSIQHRRGEAWALQNLAWISFVSGDAREAEARLDASATLFGELGDWGGMSWALGLLAWVQFTQGKLDEAAILAERILQEATELGNRWASAIMRVLLANISVWRGEPEDALAFSADAIEMFDELGDAWGTLQALGPKVLALNSLLRLTEARANIGDVDEVAQHVSDAQMLRIPVTLRVSIAVQNGEPEAYPLAERMVNELQVLGDRFLVDEQRTLWGLAQLQHGDVAGAVETLQRSVELSSNRGPAAAGAVAFAAALVAAGRPEEALQVCADADDLVVTYIDRYRLELARGFARHRLGDEPGARDAFDAAAAIVGPTHSLLDQFVVRLARSAFDSATSGGTPPVLEQRSPGWETAFALMAGTPG